MSSYDGSDLIPTAPDPTYVALVMALIRAVLQFCSGLGFAWAFAVTGDQMMMMATALVMMATVLWSFYQKFQSKRRREAAALQSAVGSADASARAGVPVAIPVTNPKV